MQIIKESYAKGLLYEQVILNLYTEDIKEKIYKQNNYGVESFEDFEFVLSNKGNSYHFGLMFNAKTIAENKHGMRRSFNRLDEDGIRYILSSSVYTLLLSNRDKIKLEEFTSDDFRYIDNYIDRQLEWYLNAVRFEGTDYPVEDEILLNNQNIKIYVEDKRLFIKYKDNVFELPSSLYNVFKTYQGNLTVFLKNILIFETYKYFGL